jgi:integrase
MIWPLGQGSFPVAADDAIRTLSLSLPGVDDWRGCRSTMRYLKPEEVRLLVDAIPERHRAMINTLAYTGICQGKATALRRKSVNLLRRELVTNQ